MNECLLRYFTEDTFCICVYHLLCSLPGGCPLMLEGIRLLICGRYLPKPWFSKNLMKTKNCQTAPV